MATNVHVDAEKIIFNDISFLYEKMIRLEVNKFNDNDMEVKVETDSHTGRFTIPINSDNYQFAKILVNNARNANKNTVVISFLDSMMLCPVCKKLVANNAMSCPSCGYVFQKNQPVTQPASQSQGSGGLGFGGTVLAIIVAIAIIGFIG